MNYSELGSELLPKLNEVNTSNIVKDNNENNNENNNSSEELKVNVVDKSLLDEKQLNENNDDKKVSFNLENNEEYEISPNVKKRKKNNDITNSLGKDLKEINNTITNNNIIEKKENTFLTIIKNNFQTILFIIFLLIILIVFIKYNNKQKEIIKNITEETIKQQNNL